MLTLPSSIQAPRLHTIVLYGYMATYNCGGTMVANGKAWILLDKTRHFLIHVLHRLSTRFTYYSDLLWHVLYYFFILITLTIIYIKAIFSYTWYLCINDFHKFTSKSMARNKWMPAMPTIVRRNKNAGMSLSCKNRMYQNNLEQEFLLIQFIWISLYGMQGCDFKEINYMLFHVSKYVYLYM